MNPVPDWQRKFRDCAKMRDEALAALERAERERDYFQSRLTDFSAVAQADFARAQKAEAVVREIALNESRIARERLSAYEEILTAYDESPTRTHGRGCPCTPCQAEDWGAIEAGLRVDESPTAGDEYVIMNDGTSHGVLARKRWKCSECGRDLHGYRGPHCRYCDGTAD